jgi:type II secretory pathway pseudopilin PulG
MKKSILIISLFFGTTAFAQTNAESNLRQNMESIQALQELLSTEYIAITETRKVIPTKTFEWSNTLVFNSFGDQSAQQQAEAMEREFGATFNGSKWKFQAIDQLNGSQTMEITTVKGEKQTANYACSGAQFTSGNLIQGIDFQAYLFQSAKNTDSYILLFSVSNGMTIAADFVRK